MRWPRFLILFDRRKVKVIDVKPPAGSRPDPKKTKQAKPIKVKKEIADEVPIPKLQKPKVRRDPNKVTLSASTLKKKYGKALRNIDKMDDGEKRLWLKDLEKEDWLENTEYNEDMRALLIDDAEGDFDQDDKKKRWKWNKRDTMLHYYDKVRRDADHWRMEARGYHRKKGTNGRKGTKKGKKK